MPLPKRAESLPLQLNFTLRYEEFKTVLVHIPNDSAPPGHFCWTTSPLVANGQKMFQSVSTSCEHIEVSVFIEMIQLHYANLGYEWSIFIC